MGDIAVGGFAAILVVLAVAVLVLWVLLPFAVFGIKERLDRIVALLTEIRDVPRPGAADHLSVAELIERRSKGGS